MKKLITFLVFLFPLFLIGQVNETPPIDFLIETCATDAAKFKVSIIQNDKGRDPLNAKIYQCLDTVQALAILYNSLDQAYSTKGKQEAKGFKALINANVFLTKFNQLGAGNFFDLQKTKYLAGMAGQWLYSRNSQGFAPITISNDTLFASGGNDVALITNVESLAGFQVTTNTPLGPLPIGAILEFRGLGNGVYLAIIENDYFILKKESS